MVTLLVVAFVVRALALTVPSSYFVISRSSIKKKCASIRPGMSAAEIDGVIHSGAWPFQEELGPDKISFMTWETCEIDLAPDTHRAIRAVFQGSGIQGG
jgi:hypothetical protein